MLKKRFGNKQQIIAKHIMDILLIIEPVASQHNIKALHRLYDLVESHVRSLRSLGVPPESYGSLLSSVLLNELHLIVSRKTGDGDWNLNALMEIVGQELEATERTATNVNPSNTTNHERKLGKDQCTAATLLSGNSPSNPTCCYCQQAHSSSICGAVRDIEARNTSSGSLGALLCA